MKMYLFILCMILLSIAAMTLALRPKHRMDVLPGAHAGELTLAPCEYKTKRVAYKAECGILIVPENRLRPASRLLALPVKRIRASGASPLEPVVFLAGGPGISNMGFKPPDGLLASHDVLLVGYRGVDGSSVLQCPEFSKAMLGDGRSVLGDGSLAMLANAIRLCRTRMEVAGVDLSGYTIQQVVEDVESARLALGYEKVNLLSESYGTRIAQVYSQLHPGSLNRSVQIGVNPPGRFVWEPGMVDAQIEYYSRLWARDDAARLRAEDLAETMRSVSHNMPERWLIFPIDAGKVNALAFVLLFQRRTSAIVFDAYVAAAQGDASGLALMSMAYDLFMPKAFVWGDFFVKGASADLDPHRDYVSTLRNPDSIIGSPVALLIWAPLSQAWPRGQFPAGHDAANPTEVDTLLVSGSIDFSTPAEYAAEELLPSLPNGRQVILSEMGHVGDLWNIQPEATLRLLTSFYDTGKADDSLFRYAPMDFKVRFGFPLLAKILLGTGILLVIGLMMGVHQVMRRWKNIT